MVYGYSSGYSSWGCVPSSHNTPYKVSGKVAPFFAIRLLAADGTTMTGYTPGATQTVELYSAVAGAKIAGVTIAPFSGAVTSCPSSCSALSGLSAGTAPLKSMSGCTGGLTQTSAQSSTSFKMNWVAPSTGTTVSFWAVVVGSGDTYATVGAQFPVAVTPSPTSTLTLSATATSTPTLIATPTGTGTSSQTPTSTGTSLPSGASQSRTPSNTPSSSVSDTATSTITPTSSPTSSGTPSALSDAMPITSSPIPNQMLSANHAPIVVHNTMSTESGIAAGIVIVLLGIGVLTFLCIEYKRYHAKQTALNKLVTQVVVTSPLHGNIL